jgi:hypothetical protein
MRAMPAAVSWRLPARRRRQAGVEPILYLDTVDTQEQGRRQNDDTAGRLPESITFEREADMHRKVLAGDRLIAAFLMGCVLFNYPVLSLFDRPIEVFEIPLMYAYVFFAWAFVIALMAWAIERRFK